MARLDKDRQNNLEPERMRYAKEMITLAGYEITYENETEVNFVYKGKTVKFFPYSGWATGSTIRSGRGLQKLLNQI